jgi:hypothetical protein
MKYQRAIKSEQKEQLKVPPSSFPPQTSFNRVTAHPLLKLQRNIGNLAVQTMLRSKDMHIDIATQTFIEPRFGHDSSQMPQHSTQAAVPQTKLRINQPGDMYEQEADQVAERVTHMANPETPVSDEAVAHFRSVMRCRRTTPHDHDKRWSEEYLKWATAIT